MPGLFQGLEIGKRALLSHQYNLQTIGHNIANVDTPGYTRQRVSISAAYPEQSAVGQIGSGIQVNNVRQIRDLFLGEQYREAQKYYGQWSYKEKILSQVESLFNEPNDNSLNNQLDNFWDSWSQLSTNSDSSNNREIILAKADQLVNGFHQLAWNLNTLRESIDRDMNNLTYEINSLTREIANLNDQIKTVELGDTRANDLRDARDYLTDQLSDIIDVNTVETTNGATRVYMGSMILVDGSDQFDIGTITENKDGQPMSTLVWEGTKVELRNLNGELSGLLEMRDKIIPEYQARLNELAGSLVTEVNLIHQSGYGEDGTTNIAFFDPNYTDASTIRLNSVIEDDISKIVSSADLDGDNLVALAISDLRNTKVMSSGSKSINEYYNSLVGSLGVGVLEATSFTSNYELMLNQIDNSRQSVQGVSLDEEMANMIKSQHAYDAAARVITAMDQALDTVISRMGIVGR